MLTEQKGIWIDLDCIETRLLNLLEYAKERHAHVMPPLNAETDWYEQEEQYISKVNDALISVRSILDQVIAL